MVLLLNINGVFMPGDEYRYYLTQSQYEKLIKVLGPSYTSWRDPNTDTEKRGIPYHRHYILRAKVDLKRVIDAKEALETGGKGEVVTVKEFTGNFPVNRFYELIIPKEIEDEKKSRIASDIQLGLTEIKVPESSSDPRSIPEALFRERKKSKKEYALTPKQYDELLGKHEDDFVAFKRERDGRKGLAASGLDGATVGEKFEQFQGRRTLFEVISTSDPYMQMAINDFLESSRRIEAGKTVARGQR